MDGTVDLVSAVEGELERLTTKNYDLIGENRKATAKAATLQQSLDAIASTLDVEGDDLDAKLKAATEKVKDLSTKLSEAETKATEAEGKVATYERKAAFAQAASKVGANAEVLERLLGDRASELVIEGDTVKLGETALKEAIEGDAALKPFLPALFPSAQATPPVPQLPTGTPNSQTQTPTDPVAGYLNKTYKASVVATSTEE